MLYIICLIVVSLVLFLYIFWDVNYFLRMTLIIFIGRFQKKSEIKDATCIYGFCTTQDVDFYFTHMNNARYVRELDFARVHFYDRIGIYPNMKAVKGHVLQGATSIRYRRPIPIFSAYKIETKLAYWEDKSLFIEQKFITFDGFVRAIVWSRQNLVNMDTDALFRNIPGAEVRPECPDEIKHWIQAIEVSSARLKNKN